VAAVFVIYQQTSLFFVVNIDKFCESGIIALWVFLFEGHPDTQEGIGCFIQSDFISNRRIRYEKK
jgi:hypothetical protein